MDAEYQLRPKIIAFQCYNVGGAINGKMMQWQFGCISARSTWKSSNSNGNNYKMSLGFCWAGTEEVHITLNVHVVSMYIMYTS